GLGTIWGFGGWGNLWSVGCLCGYPSPVGGLGLHCPHNDGLTSLGVSGNFTGLGPLLDDAGLFCRFGSCLDIRPGFFCSRVDWDHGAVRSLYGNVMAPK